MAEDEKTPEVQFVDFDENQALTKRERPPMLIDPRRFVPDLILFEGCIPWMYRDTLGYVTCAVGYLVHDAREAADLPFRVDGRAATAKEVGDDFMRVIALARGMKAAAYKAPSDPLVHLTDAACIDLTTMRLEHEFLPGIRRLLPELDRYPEAAQAALVDIAFNCGVHGLGQFSHLLAACRTKDWRAAAASCHRKTSREERNQWTESKFLEAAR